MKKQLIAWLITALMVSVQAQGTWQTAIPLKNEVWSATDSVASGRNDIYYTFSLTGESFLDLRMALFSVAGYSSSYCDVTFYRLKADSTLEKIYASSGSSDRVWASDAGDTLRWRFTKFSDGTYFVRVNRSYANGATFRFRYDWDGGAAYPNDQEPNDDYLHAVAFKPGDTVRGHCGFVDNTTGKQDYYDCYTFTVERDCDVTLRFNTTPCPGSDGGTMRFEMDSWQIMKADSSFTYSPIGGFRDDEANGVFDTVKGYRYNGLSAGTYYFRVYPYTGFGYYRFKLDVNYYEVPNDTEPDDEFMEAVAIVPGDTVCGHVGFYDQTRGKQDYYDCYKFTVDKDCHVRMQFDIQRKGDGDVRFEVESMKYMKKDSTFNTFQQIYGESQGVFDTLKRYYTMGVSPGTYYFRVYPYVGRCTYKFKVELEYPAIASEQEPNDKWSQAVALTEDDTAFGHIGYAGVQSGEKTEDVEDWYIVTLPKNGSFNVWSQCYPFGGHGFSTDDKLGLYFRLYQVEDDVLDEIGNTSGPSTWEPVDTMTYNWKTHLAKGTYYVQITRRGGYGCYKFVYETRTAPTAAFDYVQRINEKGETELCLINKTTGNPTKYQWRYYTYSWQTRSEANPTIVINRPGVYDITLVAYGTEGNDTMVKQIEINGLQRVENPRAGQGDVTLKFYAGGMNDKDSFLLERNGVEYAGTVLQRLGMGCMEVRFHLQNAPTGVYNAIIRKGSGSVMRLDNAFTLDTVIEPEIYVDLLGLEKMLYNRWQKFTAVIGNKGNVDAYNQTLWIVTPDDTNCHIQFRNVDFVKPAGDSLQWLEQLPPYLVYDSMETGGRPIRVYPLMFSVIPAGTEVMVLFRMSSDKSEDIAVFATNAFFNEGLQKDYDSYESCVTWAMGKYVAEKAVGFLLDQIPGASCVKDVIKFTYQTTESKVEGNLKAGSLAWSMATTAWSCAKDFVGPLKAYKMTCDIVDLMIDIADNYDADKECQKYKKKDNKKKRIKAVSSMDPNEMIGPSGFGAYNDVRRQDFTYNILFENKATASAPATEVTITDTLDKRPFDWNSIQFKSFGFADSVYNVQQSGLGFVSELNQDSVLVRVSGLLDTTTGIISWQFITLDPITRELVDDPDDGFLKPNRNAPEGEGFVSYIISLNDSVKDGDVIENKASIVFDSNDPILTNLYINRVDENLPSSTVLRVEEAEKEGDYTVFFSGTDKGSGVYFYSLYMSVDNGEKTLVSDHIEGESYTLHLAKDSVYSFYVYATDSLYLREEEKSLPDYVFCATGISLPGNDVNGEALTLRLQPNPARNATRLSFRNSTAGNVRLEICDMLGCKVYEKDLGHMEAGMHSCLLELSSLSRGVYAVRLKCGQVVRGCKLSVN